jgi:hypothetical protein
MIERERKGVAVERGKKCVKNVKMIYDWGIVNVAVSVHTFNTLFTTYIHFIFMLYITLFSQT